MNRSLTKPPRKQPSLKPLKRDKRKQAALASKAPIFLKPSRSRKAAKRPAKIRRTPATIAEPASELSTEC